MAEIAVTYVVGKLSDLLIQESVLLCGVRDQIDWIKRELRRMHCFLKDAEAKQNSDERVKNWVDDMREVAYDAEDIIDTYVLKLARERRKGFVGFVKRYTLLFNELIDRRKVVNEIERIKVKILEISESRSTYGIENIGGQQQRGLGGENASSISESLREWRRSFPHVEEPDVIGFEHEAKTLVERLTKGELRRCVVSIVGMGGLGKTTLAKKVYNSNGVKSHFDCCAWVYVSQEYRAREILQDISRRVMGIGKEELEKMNKDELEEKLFEFLGSRRYLIVIDDIWTTQAWDGLKASFPDRMNGSRILLTTRIRDVAICADPRSAAIELGFLNSTEAWELFCKKVFPVGIGRPYCPFELEKLGKQIVMKCAGLPLAVVVLGGLLSTKERTLSAWSKVLKGINWQLTEGQKQCSEILALSYNDLPFYLKLCFLYFGLFPEDSEIPTRKLILLWVAEGFIQQRGDQTMEEVAEDFLEDLICRSMIQGMKRSSGGGFKTCRIHDLLRDLSILKAREDNFLNVYADEEFVFPTRVRRLGIHHSIDKFMALNLSHSTPVLRSLFSFDLDDKFLRGDEWKFLCGCLKLLRVIDLKGVYVSTLPKEIGELIHLRYLGLRQTSLKTLPSSIGNLRNLRTLDIRSDFPLSLPKVVWKLSQLRHLYLTPNASISHIPANNSLKNLQTLTMVREGIWIEDGLSRLRNLRKLGITGNLITHMTTLSSHIVNLVDLRSLNLQQKHGSLPTLCRFSNHLHLHKLYLEGRLEKLPKLHEYPPNLTKLSLAYSELKINLFETLEKLPNIRILRLLRGSYLGKVMVCSGGGFPRLESLKLFGLIELEEWRVEEGALPRLRHLEIDECNRLRMLPEGLRHVSTLEELDMKMPAKFNARLQKYEGEDWYKIQHVPSVISKNRIVIAGF